MNRHEATPRVSHRVDLMLIQHAWPDYVASAIAVYVLGEFIGVRRAGAPGRRRRGACGRDRGGVVIVLTVAAAIQHGRVMRALLAERLSFESRASQLGHTVSRTE